MRHAISLRAIGQNLDTIGVEVFALTYTTGSYAVHSESLTPTCKWILRNRLAQNVREGAGNAMTMDIQGGDGWLNYNSSVVSSLQVQGEKKRASGTSGNIQQMKLSNLLRSLGERLDTVEALTFTIDWSPQSIYVEYYTMDGQHGRKLFTAQQLRQLCVLAVSHRRNNFIADLW